MERASDLAQGASWYFSGRPVKASPRNDVIMIVWPMRWNDTKRT